MYYTDSGDTVSAYLPNKEQGTFSPINNQKDTEITHT